MMCCAFAEFYDLIKRLIFVIIFLPIIAVIVFTKMTASVRRRAGGHPVDVKGDPVGHAHAVVAAGVVTGGAIGLVSAPTARVPTAGLPILPT